MPNPSDPATSRGPFDLYDPPELTGERWEAAGRRLLAKIVGEFAYEEILRPVRVVRGAAPGQERAAAVIEARSAGAPEGEGAYTAGDEGAGAVEEEEEEAVEEETEEGEGAADAAAYEGLVAATYTVLLDEPAAPGGPRPRLTFRARRASYGSWRVEPESLTLTDTDGRPRPCTDPLRFLTAARRTLELDGATLGHLIRELTVTLSADTRLDHGALTAGQLADLGYAELEGHQTGHPWLVLNKGRIGFSATDARQWAPEARTPTAIPWIAVHTAIATYRGVPGLAAPDDLYAGELDPATRETYEAILRARGLEPREYLYLPVHPWQWDDVVLPLFAPSVAAGMIVPLPSDGDLRLPQQSIRTFLNTTRPERHTVKLPLSVLNTLVWRGLPTERTLAAAAVTSWVRALRDSDPFLRDECRVILLGEVASVAVEHPVYDSLPEVPYQYKELLGAIWREPLTRHLAPGERARTLAALLHTDPQGRAFVAELVDRSGMTPTTWLTHLFAALLPPLLQFLYRYGTVFSPHGENAIVVFDDKDVPVRLAVKDFVDDVNVSAEPVAEHASMPDDVRDILLTEPPAFLTQFIHAGLFVGVFRYLAPLCEEQLGVPEGDFWALVRAEILRHQARAPELKERYELFDLLTPRIERLCLNRNRLHLDGYRDRAERPHAAVHGSVPNPLHQP
ncbi:IucA/IucC family protein [Streptomyces silvensis]|uniref:IucA/IucC family protein n=1 Tax=Streptomyces silvensis TaxID=1765722 RepID=A0A0W7WRF5_9ACTN|nr:IucA/IucC family siderophore biosynthesis protein [Streptomyces silvensis]KUF13142.1 IucA/IucC family protein [Streptomyces silvensis]